MYLLQLMNQEELKLWTSKKNSIWESSTITRRKLMPCNIKTTTYILEVTTLLSDIMMLLQAKLFIHMTTHILIILNQSKHLKIITSLLVHMTVLWNCLISESMKKLNSNLYIKNKSNLWTCIHQSSTLLLVVEIKSLFGILEQENLYLRDVIIKK